MDNEGFNALQTAFFFYKKKLTWKVAKLLIEKGLPVNSVSLNGMNLLHFACKTLPLKNLVPVIKMLVRNGIHRDETDSRGFTALRVLIERNISSMHIRSELSRLLCFK